ncbi:MAG: sulfurtransferase TusA family protein [Halobacteriota archaeon]
MSSEYEVTETLDVMGLSCPMPIVRTKGAIDDLPAGGVLEVIATDPGSMSDIEGWAASTQNVELLDQQEGTADGETVYKHYVHKEE